MVLTRRLLSDIIAQCEGVPLSSVAVKGLQACESMYEDGKDAYKVVGRPHLRINRLLMDLPTKEATKLLKAFLVVHGINNQSLVV